MKKSILTVQDVFTLLLQEMYFTEDRFRHELASYISQVTSVTLKEEMNRYAESTQYKLLKLERIFNYLFNESSSRKSEVIEKMIAETNTILQVADSGCMKDILMMGCIQNVNAYKTASYRTACLFSVVLELDTVGDLLQQILKWEKQAGDALALLASREFCRLTGEISKQEDNAWKID
ncbi:YciE/YciF ferroxidase family protein [Ohtaekwangia koreensis]|uniref:Ferritin-like metal-binding protein YciE n=1 Tax=Ohtaekwangia koreensis TaxID=688867 RepID=A0A1T5M5F2_9BACT|nr:DUF892 family protein [Ohtaekwangia koreensis]SKC83440.1 Ferritin-like metal-binding protein YciE [Ohtaekwangia koreensis]